MNRLRTLLIFGLVALACMSASCSSSRGVVKPFVYEYTYRSYDSIVSKMWENITPEQLEAEFVKRKGTYLMPVIDISTITVHYGRYTFPDQKNVTLQQNGVKILCNFNNVNACSIFYGRVSAVFKTGDLYNVLIRHGSYISGYFGLYNVAVGTGDFVVPRQAIGQVYNNYEEKSILQFQIRKETEALNPEEWLKKE